MAPHFGQGARRSAHHAARSGQSHNTSSANDIPPGPHQTSYTSTRYGGSRASETRRKRDRRGRRSELKTGRSSSPTGPLKRPGRLEDRVTHNHGDQERTSSTSNGTQDPRPRPQQGHRLQRHVTHGEAVDGNGGPSRSSSPLNGHQAQAVNNHSAPLGDTDMAVDDFADLFSPNPPLSRPPRERTSTKPIQYGSSHHLPFNHHLHAPRPVQPATRREPIRIVNSWTPHEPDIDGPLPGSATLPSPSPASRPEANKHPVNTYKGRDPIKRRVQNKLLQCILSGKSLPKARKKPDRMILKCAGKQEFR